MTTSENLLNLASQILAGEYRNDKNQVDEQKVKDQVMRVWRGVDFAAPAGRRLELVTLESNATAAAAVTLPADDEAPSAGPAPAPAKVRCSQSRQHGAIKNRGGSCSECGYNAPATPEA